MKKIKNLNELIKRMKPKLTNKEYVFCTLSEDKLKRLQLDPLLVYKEKEGVTFIIEKKFADANLLSYSSVWKLITLTVHSDLLAVGFLARITSELAKAGISVNVVSAYYHDHLFISQERVDKAMKILKRLKAP